MDTSTKWAGSVDAGGDRDLPREEWFELGSRERALREDDGRDRGEGGEGER